MHWQFSFQECIDMSYNHPPNTYDYQLNMHKGSPHRESLYKPSPEGILKVL